MKVHSSKLAFSAALTMSLFYMLAALFVYRMPIPAAKMLAPLFYMSPTILIPYINMTIPALISGMIQSFIYTYLYVMITGLMYNKILG